MPSHTGLLHSDIRGSLNMCFSPRLFAAYDVLLRLSSPRHPPSTYFSLDHIIISAFPAPFRFRTLFFFFHSSAAYFHSDFQDKSIPFPSPVHVPLPFFCMHRLQAVRILLHVSFPFHLSKITSRKVLFQHNFPLPMENRGLEPLTFGLQSRRSSQLS